MTTDIRGVLAAEPTYEELYDLADEYNGDVVLSMRAALARWGRPATPVALPPNYIDPEHQGADRQLLEIFYLACNAEGGTADEIHLRGIKAVLAARPAAPAAPEVQRDAVIAAVTKALGDAYDCLRVWEAWRCPMTECLPDRPVYGCRPPRRPLAAGPGSTKWAAMDDRWTGCAREQGTGLRRSRG